MRIRLAILMVAMTAAVGFARAAELPAKLVGTWSTPGTEFEGGKLIGGEALYLVPSGMAAMVGAPLPVGRCADGRVCTPIIGVAGVATFDQASGRMTVNLRSGAKSLMVEGHVDAADGALVLKLGQGEPKRFTRRDAAVPADLAADLDKAR